VLLRVGASSWPHGPDVLNVPLATVNTLVLVTSSMTIVMAWLALKENDFGRFQRMMLVTVVLGLLFLGIKGFEYADKFSHGHYPETSTFYAIYFVLTGTHVLHLAGGVLVAAYHALFGGGLWKREPERFTNRIEITGLYWHFVDLVWLVVFATLYLT
jgi:heme/copper-type cytochrome/quinol oxidase subunit 3